jgi:hypothetical protein
MSAFGFCRSEFFGTVERSIYKTIFFLPLFFLLFLCVPFIGISIGLIFHFKFIGDNKFILYSDNNIRIEQPYIRFMSRNAYPIVYAKQRLTSYQDTILSFHYNEAKDKVEVEKYGDSTYIITFKSPENWEVPTGTQAFYYVLRNKR